MWQMVWSGKYTMVSVTLSNVFNSRSAVGLSIPFLAQAPQQECQSAVREIQFADLHSSDSLNRFASPTNPGLHRQLAMIALSESGKSVNGEDRYC